MKKKKHKTHPFKNKQKQQILKNRKQRSRANMPTVEIKLNPQITEAIKIFHF